MRARTERSPGAALAYSSWRGMLERCRYPKAKAYPNYGGRGIIVCPQWSSFANFLNDMGPRPSKSHTLERTNNDGNYEPGNAVWALRSEQNRNNRRNVMLSMNGETRCLTDWCARYGMQAGTVQGRLDRGWSLERALTQKPNPGIWGNRKDRQAA